ncbi:MAG: hypothetical protein QNL12_13185 [Acidimicrobiia bacterium]|nr:hypothetical protein [Acidimicrobiia bacterium]MDX2468266.1 hypothetical protein [Acidimicrobiia bacterium]
MIDAVASDYQDSIEFIAVAGRSDYDPTAARAEELLFSNVAWGLDESIWELYGILGQPASVMISGDDIVAYSWYGVLGEEGLRERFDVLAGL